MALYREAAKCLKCGEPYKAINRPNNGSFIGDDFIRWDYENHVCAPISGDAPKESFKEELQILTNKLAIGTPIEITEAMLLFAQHQHKITRNETVADVVKILEDTKHVFDIKISRLKNAIHPHDKGRLSGFECTKTAFDDLITAIKQLKKP